eukprot:jgi/Chrzof1/633/Cz01g23060.t1
MPAGDCIYLATKASGKPDDITTTSYLMLVLDATYLQMSDDPLPLQCNCISAYNLSCLHVLLVPCNTLLSDRF